MIPRNLRPMLFLITPQQPGYVYPFAIIFGLAMGADYMLIPLMAADLFGVRSLARAMSGIVPTFTKEAPRRPALSARQPFECRMSPPAGGPLRPAAPASLCRPRL